MANCEDNVPPQNMTAGEFLLLEFDPTGWLEEKSRATWVEHNVKYAEFYGIDLCNEADAHAIAGFIQGGLNVGWRSPELLSARQHWNFLNMYATQHGVSVASPVPQGSDGLVNTLSEIKALTSQYSVPSQIPPKPVEIRTGRGTIVLGDENPLFCDPNKVDIFKSTTRTQRAPVNSTKDWFIYQIEKCGTVEYELETLKTYLNFVVPENVMAYIDHEFADVMKKLADGLTSRAPGAPKKNYGCCATDAKMVMNYRFTMYQTARRLRREKNRQHAGKPKKVRKWLVRTAMARWAAKRGTAVYQMLGYAAACIDPNIPVTRFLYIVSHDIAEDYFDEILGGPNLIGHVIRSRPNNGDNWIG